MVEEVAGIDSAKAIVTEQKACYNWVATADGTMRSTYIEKLLKPTTHTERPADDTTIC